MRSCGWRVTGSLVGLIFAGWLLGMLGCSEDEVEGPPLGDLTPGNWSRLKAGQATDPTYGPPGTPADGLMALSSFRVGAAGDSLGQYNHIWVLDLAADSLFQITGDADHDYDPAWSGSGDRLCFTRDNGARRDVFWVDVSDIRNPGPPVRVTSVSVALTGATEGDWMRVGDEDYIVFSDGSDLLRVPTSGGSPVKIVPDPGDFSDPDCGGSLYEDLQPTPGPGDKVAFVSRGRARVGSIEIRARGTGGEPTTAFLWLEGCDTLGVLDSVAFYSHRPEGNYRVMGVKDGVGLCDTLDYFVAVEPGTSQVELDFVPTRGRVLVRSISLSSDEFPYYVDCEVTETQATPAAVANPLDSLIFTPLYCMEAGVHIISGAQGVAIDTTWVEVLAGEETRATLVFADSAWGYYPHGGEGEFYWRTCPTGSICADSVCVDTNGAGDCIEWACTEWDCETWFKYWAAVDTLCGELEGPGLRSLGWAFPPLRSPAQAGQEEVWVYDTGEDAFLRLSDLVSPGDGAVQRPVWDPVPGHERIAVITWMGSHWGVQVVDLQAGSLADIPLPGMDGPLVCQRDAVVASWSPGGDSLAVALGPCGGGSYPEQLEIWTVELGSLGLP